MILNQLISRLIQTMQYTLPTIGKESVISTYDMPRVLPRVHRHPHGQTHQVLASATYTMWHSQLIQTTHCTLLAMIMTIRISFTSHVPLHVLLPLHGQILALLPLAKLVHDYRLQLILRITHTYPIRLVRGPYMLVCPLDTPLALHRV